MGSRVTHEKRVRRSCARADSPPRTSPGCTPRSAWIWAHAPPPRWPCRSSPS
jgi:hypothetical protein